LEATQRCSHYTADASAAILVLSVGDAAPGAYEGEPTYGMATPSYKARMQAVADKSATARDASTLRVWSREAELLRTAASDDMLGFYVRRCRGVASAETMDSSEVLECLQATTAQYTDAWSWDVLLIQQWYLQQEYRVYDFDLCFFPPRGTQRAAVRFRTNGWVYKRPPFIRAQGDDAVVRGLDNVVLLFDFYTTGSYLGTALKSECGASLQIRR